MCDAYLTDNLFSDGVVFTPAEAFFLGGILMSCKYWMDEHDKVYSSVRYESGLDYHWTHDHMVQIETLAESVGGTIREVPRGRNRGFDIVFDRLDAEDISIEYLLDQAVQLRLHGSRLAKESFLAGVLDGRSSVDTNSRRFFSIDRPRVDMVFANEIEQVVNGFAEDLNCIHRSNPRGGTDQHRNTDRPPQIRIKLDEAAMHIGMVSPKRLNDARSCLPFGGRAFCKKAGHQLPGVEVLPDDERAIQELRNEAPDHERQLGITYEETHLQEDDGNQVGARYQNEAPRPVPQRIDRNNGMQSYARSRAVCLNAYENSGHECEVDDTHATFLRRNNLRPYLEMHHLVPMALQNLFDVSLDVEENVVALCSNCHREIHYGANRDVLIRQLLDQREEGLRRVGIVISHDTLVEAYNLNYAGL